MKVNFDIESHDDYQLFLKIKTLPVYRISGRSAYFPDEYASMLGMKAPEAFSQEFKLVDGLFDYQKGILETAIAKGKYAVFADCGLGKTRILLEFARYANWARSNLRRVLIVSPLMVCEQTRQEAITMYGDDVIDFVPSSKLADWIQEDGGAIGITNYEALNEDIPQGNLGALILDESSMLKSHYGAWGQQCIRLGKGLPFKMALTGTPAPNDRIEFANHAVFLDQYPTVNSFLAKYFVNRGQTDNRWEMKPHAREPFYRSLSHWSIFISNPSVYGWKDNTRELPPINTHFHSVPLTKAQQDLVFDKTGSLFADQIGGITSRSVLSQIAKGNYKGKRIETKKTEQIKKLVESWPNESTIIWCLYNEEQKIINELFPDAASIDGSTPLEKRHELINDFKSGVRKVLISKPKVLGFGLNLQIATRHIFSGLQDSYESYYQAVKRSNRYGSTKPLNVHIPFTDIERPMIDTVMSKADRVDQDTKEQERIFQCLAS